MTEDEIYETWAPRDGRWSPWVKPVLFSFIHRASDEECVPAFTGLEQLHFAPDTAVVIDLPGPESVAAGVALAARGWRPLSLFNALPADGAVAVNVDGLVTALRNATSALRGCPLPPTAPPAFLLDSRRGAPGWKPRPDTFDNRSISFPTDFPSAAKLREHGITRVLLVQQGNNPQRDLVHTLRQWQETGLGMDLLEPGPNSRPRPNPIHKVTKLGLWWLKFLSLFNTSLTRPGAYGRLIVSSG